MTQPSAELARCLTLDPLALTKEFRSTLKLGGSERRLVDLADGLQQLLQLILGKFFIEQDFLAAFVLQGFLVALTVCFSTVIHIATPAAVQVGFTHGIVADRFAQRAAPSCSLPGDLAQAGALVPLNDDERKIIEKIAKESEPIFP